MFKKINKRRELIGRILSYITMVSAVIVIVTVITSILLGFRFNFDDRQLERYAFLRFNSTPSGAMVLVDGEVLNQKTPTKSSVKPGEHEIIIRRNGYKDWNKVIDIKAGTLTWLNYALLIPEDLKTEALTDYNSVYSSLTSPNNKAIVIQPEESLPNFELVEINSNISKSSSLILDPIIYSGSDDPTVVHRFYLQKWDDSDRYLVVLHYYNDNSEWLVIDTQNIGLSKNITKTFDIAINQIEFSGTGGNNYFILGNNDIRKLDLTAGTISKVLVSGVELFSVYNSNIIVFVSQYNEETKSKSVGLYRDGDDEPRLVVSPQSELVKVATTRYFNEDYIAYSEGRDVYLFSGNYPDMANKGSESQRFVASFSLDYDISGLSFSPTGQYLLARTNDSFISYDIEYGSLSALNFVCSSSESRLDWLNETYLWSSCDNKLSIREFDGANHSHIINVINNQTVLLTHNNRYIYSFNKTDTGYQLQRTKLVAS